MHVKPGTSMVTVAVSSLRSEQPNASHTLILPVANRSYRVSESLLFNCCMRVLLLLYPDINGSMLDPILSDNQILSDFIS